MVLCSPLKMQYRSFTELICADRVPELSGAFKVRDEEDWGELSLGVVQWLQERLT